MEAQRDAESRQGAVAATLAFVFMFACLRDASAKLTNGDEPQPPQNVNCAGLPADDCAAAKEPPKKEPDAKGDSKTDPSWDSKEWDEINSMTKGEKDPMTPVRLIGQDGKVAPKGHALTPTSPQELWNKHQDWQPAQGAPSGSGWYCSESAALCAQKPAQDQAQDGKKADPKKTEKGEAAKKEDGAPDGNTAFSPSKPDPKTPVRPNPNTPNMDVGEVNPKTGLLEDSWALIPRNGKNGIFDIYKCEDGSTDCEKGKWYSLQDGDVSMRCNDYAGFCVEDEIQTKVASRGGGSDEALEMGGRLGSDGLEQFPDRKTVDEGGRAVDDMLGGLGGKGQGSGDPRDSGVGALNMGDGFGGRLAPVVPAAGSQPAFQTSPPVGPADSGAAEADDDKAGLPGQQFFDGKGKLSADKAKYDPCKDTDFFGTQKRSQRQGCR